MIARPPPDTVAIGRVVATELKPSTPHQFHFWTANETTIGHRSDREGSGI